jgi:hypothetical protein
MSPSIGTFCTRSAYLEATSRRIAHARLDPTFLMADVEVVVTYELYDINRTRLENLIHRVFGPGASTSRSRIASGRHSLSLPCTTRTPA